MEHSINFPIYHIHFEKERNIIPKKFPQLLKSDKRAAANANAKASKRAPSYLHVNYALLLRKNKSLTLNFWP